MLCNNQILNKLYIEKDFQKSRVYIKFISHHNDIQQERVNNLLSYSHIQCSTRIMDIFEYLEKIIKLIFI